MSARKSENWLLVEWSEGGRDVVYLRSVLSPLNKELRPGDELTVNRRGEQHAATLVERAQERHQLDSKLKRQETPGPSPTADDDRDGFSSSASSWEPSDDGASSGDESVKSKNKKQKLDTSLRQYSNRRTSKILTPSHRANAVIPKNMQQNIIHNNSARKRTRKEVISINKSTPDSTRRKVISQNKTESRKVTIDARELENIMNSFQMLFKMINEMKRQCISSINNTNYEESKHDMVIPEVDDDKENILTDQDQEEEFNRSDDNVLITNKYDNITTAAVKRSVKSVKEKLEYKEWVPIGSGKTLIHKDQFNKINWKSYTIATRTLLLAVFPRRILATHSLTGKRSPAFQDKPAKMCLDPKIISDVIMEVMDRFNVKENLVRGIITTKCADECKMLKTRVSRKKAKIDRQNTKKPLIKHEGLECTKST